MSHELIGWKGATLCVPFYRNVDMLKRQIEEWNKYRGALQILLVDDCSPEPAEPIVKEFASKETQAVLEVYRTGVDVKWAREFCRNLMAKVATTKWLVMVDIDHVLPVESVNQLLGMPISPKRWYRFRRMRVGKADETRRKDKIAPECEFGEIHPHVDSYLCVANHYWNVGGYDEQFCGVLGGGNEFLRRFQATYPVETIAGDVFLHVYTRSVIEDASDLHCGRDTKPGKDIERYLRTVGREKPTEWLTLPWSRVL